MTKRFFTINRPLVVDETIDGETIVIHLGTGTYYSLDGVASAIWKLAEDGTPPQEILARLREAYPTAASVETDLEALLMDLAAEDLLHEQAGSPDGAWARTPLELSPAYETPLLHKYTDMQAFMLTDPLHDVDAGAGWPHVASA